MTYTPTQGEGTVTPTEDLGNGKYRTRYTTGPVPMENKVEAEAQGDITVPEVLLDPFAVKCTQLIPSFSGIPAYDLYRPECKTAITQYSEGLLECSGGICKLPTRAVTMKSGQQVVFQRSGELTLPTVFGSENKVEQTLYGVMPKIPDIEPKAIFLREDGYTIQDTKINYSIEPLQYNAIAADIDIYEREPKSTDPDNDIWVDWLPGSATQGDGIATIFRRADFDINKEYYAQVVLNRGSDAEVRGEKYPLPIGQFKLVSDEDGITLMEGAVTEGAARLRLQLIAKNNLKAFSGLTWNLIDPQVLDYTPTSIRGAFVSGTDLVDSMPVTFNTDGIAEVVYRSPESFVRWGTSYETEDKDIPERSIQPTVDLQNYLKTQKDPLPTIRLKRPPVVLVHGLWGCGDKDNEQYAWKVFEPRFNDKRLYDIFSVNYYEAGQVRSIADHSYRLGAKINTATDKLRASGFATTKVDVIAHSMGGLLTRQYCFDNQTECQNKIRRFVTIATPHFGSELADLLVVYRDDNDHFPNPFPFVCKGIIDSFVNGFNYRVLGKDIRLAPSPVSPVGGAIDDLATGVLPPFMQSQAKTYMGRWADLPPLSTSLSSHTIVGLSAADRDGYDLQVWGLWNLILEPCGIKRQDLFGTEADLNDRIVKESSQKGGVVSDKFTVVSETDHFTVRNSDETVERIRLLLDKAIGSNLFTK